MTQSAQPPVPGPQMLVDSIRARGDTNDQRVLDAFLTMPRALFLPGVPLDQVYQDDAIILKREADGTVVSSSSQPSMMALMINQMRLQKGHNVLEIGTGSGYNAAIMQTIVEPGGLVTTIEVDPQLAEHAQDALQRARMSHVLVVQGDGATGYAPRASYDRILATAGIWEVPRTWVKQLKPRGMIVAPIWFEGQQYSAAFQRQPDGTLYSERNLPCGFVHLRGVAAGPVLDMRVGSGSLAISSGQLNRVDAVALQMLLNADAQDGHLGHVLSSSDYIYSAMPFLALCLPEEDVFATYSVLSDQQPYGIEGHGFAVIAKGSACFVGAHEQGRAHVFGGADTLLAVQDGLNAWQAAGTPSVNRLRLRLTPADSGTPPQAPRGGRVYLRGDHYLEVWFDKR